MYVVNSNQQHLSKGSVSVLVGRAPVVVCSCTWVGGSRYKTEHILHCFVVVLKNTIWLG
jgi:hypothetical protein